MIIQRRVVSAHGEQCESVSVTCLWLRPWSASHPGQIEGLLFGVEGKALRKKRYLFVSVLSFQFSSGGHRNEARVFFRVHAVATFDVRNDPGRGAHALIS